MEFRAQALKLENVSQSIVDGLYLFIKDSRSCTTGLIKKASAAIKQYISTKLGLSEFLNGRLKKYQIFGWHYTHLTRSCVCDSSNTVILCLK